MMMDCELTVFTMVVCAWCLWDGVRVRVAGRGLPELSNKWFPRGHNLKGSCMHAMPLSYNAMMRHFADPGLRQRMVWGFFLTHLRTSNMVQQEN